MSIALAAVALSLVGCEQASWKMANRSLAALARDVAYRAECNDIQYFMAVSPARERVPDLIRQIARSGLATNYAEHLLARTPTEASLNYGVKGDLTPGASFAIELSLVDGEPRIDQIICYQVGDEGLEESSGIPESFSQAISSYNATRSTIGTASVSVTTASGQIIADSEQFAVVRYINTSSECMSVSRPLDVVLWIADDENRVVSWWEPADVPYPTNAVFLAPWETVYRFVRFRAPVPGHYVLYGSADGVQASAIYLRTISSR